MFNQQRAGTQGEPSIAGEGFLSHLSSGLGDWEWWQHGRGAGEGDLGVGLADIAVLWRFLRGGTWGFPWGLGNCHGAPEALEWWLPRHPPGVFCKCLPVGTPGATRSVAFANFYGINISTVANLKLPLCCH